ncbi:MAG TPA: hypothetical protein VHN15_01770 [Thermoanaerobaculia bacterium]|nr:hypothetical protein [Thermoanaerobaculia bacterium]
MRILKADQVFTLTEFSEDVDWDLSPQSIYRCPLCNAPMTFCMRDFKRHAFQNLTNLGTEDRAELERTAPSEDGSNSFLDFYCPGCAKPTRITFTAWAGGRFTGGYILNSVLVGEGAVSPQKAVIEPMLALLSLLGSHCSDRSTLDELFTSANDQQLWRNGHHLFQRIRQKTLIAERAGDEAALAQCLFEEVCAKTLYNLSGGEAPFDADSPSWILPNALVLARVAGIREEEVLRCVPPVGGTGAPLQG